MVDKPQSKRKRCRPTPAKQRVDTRPAVLPASGNVPATGSSLGLPQQEGFYMQHYLREFSHNPRYLLNRHLTRLIPCTDNLARIALAIDYTENGYRELLPMAFEEPALMNGILAVASAHYCRWQNITDENSAGYLRAAVLGLSLRFNETKLISSPVTLACILIMITYEVEYHPSLGLKLLQTFLAPNINLYRNYRSSPAPVDGCITTRPFVVGSLHARTALTCLLSSRIGCV